MSKHRWLAGALVAAAVAIPAAAQEGPTYRLDENTLNVGGRPEAGLTAVSASFRISLDALGSPVARPVALFGSAYSIEPGFIPPYRPAGEVVLLLLGSSKQTLFWTAEPTVGDYVLYRGTLSSLNGTSWGACLQTGITTTSAVDADVPTVSQGFFYLVAARNLLREEGTLGTTSDGDPRTPSAPCP